MNLQSAQLALSQLFQGGAFQWPQDVATVPYQEYRDIIEAIEPAENYTIGYDLGGINWLENCYLDKDENDRVEMIRRERTWQYGPLRAFQLELTTVPQLIMITNEPNEPTILNTTWFVDNQGVTRNYVQVMNGVTVEDIRG